MMVTENLQKLHKICFGAFSIIFIFRLKIDLIVCEPHCVIFIFRLTINLIVCEPDCVKLNFLWTSSIVKVFDFLTFDILWHMKYNLQFFYIFDIF